MRKPKVAQEHFVLMGGGPPAKSPLRHAADLLGMVIGDDSGSRLYWALVDPGLADSADCSFHEYDGTGVFYTSFSCEPDDAEANLALVHGVLRAGAGRRHHGGGAGDGPEQAAVAHRAQQRAARGPAWSTLGMQWTLPGRVPLGGRRPQGLRGGDARRHRAR